LKHALISGIAGQDGTFLPTTGYEMRGIKRRASSLDIDCIDHLYRICDGTSLPTSRAS